MIFLRHPRPDVEPGICYGQLDLDIHAEGHGQIERAVASTPKVVRLLASPAKRCRLLAEAIARRDGLEIEFDPRLWEMHMGDWEGLAWKDIPRDLSESWLKDPVNLPTPGGESFADLQKRVLAAIDGIDATTAIICHAGPIRAVQMAVHGWSFRDAFAQTPPYAEPIQIVRT